MSNVEEFSDSTDWLPTPLAALTPLESSLRCQVCKDFFTTPMITSCSHTFCSLCIRRYLSQEGRCPACREQDQEMKLRRNWVVEELVTNFKTSRAGLLHYAQNAIQKPEDNRTESERPKKRRKLAETPVQGVERRSTRSRTKQVESHASQQSIPSTQEQIADSDDESTYDDTESKPTPSRPAAQDDSHVECPCCTRRVKATIINSHLDSCMNGDSNVGVEDSSSPAPVLQAAPVTIAYNQTKPSNYGERLPFINYNILNDNALRKKLKELGISSTGSKDLMRRRHTEWVNLWNSNCDSLNPVAKWQLLARLEKWEKTLGRQLDKGPSGVMVKDFDRETYAKIQKSNFEDLIAQARRKRPTAVKVEGTEGAEISSDSSVPQDNERSSESLPEVFAAGQGPEMQELNCFTTPEPSSVANQIPNGVSSTEVVDLTSPERRQSGVVLSQKSMNHDITT